MITIALFIAVYALIFVAWARIVGRFISEGPVLKDAESKDESKEA